MMVVSEEDGKKEAARAMAEAYHYNKAVGDLGKFDCSLENIYNIARERLSDLEDVGLIWPSENTRLYVYIRLPEPTLVKDFISAYETDPNSKTSKSLGAYSKEYMLVAFQLISLKERTEKLKKDIMNQL